MIENVQSNFRGGMNILDHDAVLAEDEYGLAFNVRNRITALETIKNNIEDIHAPTGLKQGIYGFDKYLVLFNSGRAYYKNVDDEEWTLINAIALDRTVDYIFTQAVPASTLNYTRKLNDANRINGTSNESNLSIDPISINSTPAGLVVQDGVNQGWIVFADA